MQRVHLSILHERPLCNKRRQYRHRSSLTSLIRLPWRARFLHPAATWRLSSQKDNSSCCWDGSNASGRGRFHEKVEELWSAQLTERWWIICTHTSFPSLIIVASNSLRRINQNIIRFSLSSYHVMILVCSKPFCEFTCMSFFLIQSSHTSYVLIQFTMRGHIMFQVNTNLLNEAFAFFIQSKLLVSAHFDQSSTVSLSVKRPAEFWYWLSKTPSFARGYPKLNLTHLLLRYFQQISPSFIHCSIHLLTNAPCACRLQL